MVCLAHHHPVRLNHPVRLSEVCSPRLLHTLPFGLFGDELALKDGKFIRKRVQQVSSYQFQI